MQAENHTANLNHSTGAIICEESTLKRLCCSFLCYSWISCTDNFSNFIPKVSLSLLHSHLVLTLQTFCTPKVELTAISKWLQVFRYSFYPSSDFLSSAFPHNITHHLLSSGWESSQLRIQLPHQVFPIVGPSHSPKIAVAKYPVSYLHQSNNTCLDL